MTVAGPVAIATNLPAPRRVPRSVRVRPLPTPKVPTVTHRGASRRLRQAVASERSATRDVANEPLYALCPYYRQVGDRRCFCGCWEEPTCMTSEPTAGWPRPWVLGDARRRGRRMRSSTW